MLAAGSSRATVGETDRSRKERSQPALRLPGSDHIESRAVGRLAALIGEVIVGLQQPPGDEPFHAVVARCNAALEACIEDEREREPPVVTAQAELERLCRQLTADDGGELTQIMRQIRCVLGRLDNRRHD